MRKLRVRSSGRTFAAVLLVAAAIFLSAAIWRLSDLVSANKDDPTRYVFFWRMLYLTLVLLALTLILLALRGSRWILSRFRAGPPAKPTTQGSAWEEAGRRFELPPDDDREKEHETPPNA